MSHVAKITSPWCAKLMPQPDSEPPGAFHHKPPKLTGAVGPGADPLNGMSTWSSPPPATLVIRSSFARAAGSPRTSASRYVSVHVKMSPVDATSKPCFDAGERDELARAGEARNALQRQGDRRGRVGRAADGEKREGHAVEAVLAAPEGREARLSEIGYVRRPPP